MPNTRELIYKDEARRAILQTNSTFAYCINNIKPVDAVEVVHAKAVPIYSNIKYEDTLIRMDSQCPLCGALMLKVDNYCPNCGAKMDGGNEDG